MDWGCGAITVTTYGRRRSLLLVSTGKGRAATSGNLTHDYQEWPGLLWKSKFQRSAHVDSRVSRGHEVSTVAVETVAKCVVEAVNLAR